MSDKDITYVGTTGEVEIDYPDWDENRKPFLVFKGNTSGCGCCSWGVEVTGNDDILDNLDYHADSLRQAADWYQVGADLLREHGEAAVRDGLVRVEEISRTAGEAANKARHADEGTILTHYPKWVRELGGLALVRDGIQTMVDEAIEGYARLGTVDKLIAEHFDSHTLMWIGKHLAALASRDYELDGKAAELAKEHQDE
jgi:hypothetical protein